MTTKPAVHRTRTARRDSTASAVRRRLRAAIAATRRQFARTHDSIVELLDATAAADSATGTEAPTAAERERSERALNHAVCDAIMLAAALTGRFGDNDSRRTLARILESEEPTGIEKAIRLTEAMTDILRAAAHGGKPSVH